MADTVDIHSLAGAYVLDAVDDIERAAFDRHLRGCTSCTAEVAELRETTTWLSHPVATTPPAGLRDAVLAQVSRTPQERPKRSGAAGSTGGSAAARRWQRWTAVAAAVSVLGIGVAAGTWTISEQRVRAERAITAQYQSILAAPDAKLVRMAVEGGHVNFVFSPSHDAGVALLDGLASPGPDQTYQLWMIGGSNAAPKNVGVVGTGKTSGRQVIRGLGNADTFGVSRETAGGAPAPTVVVGTVDLFR
jgi:anti-sigma-K factor RskA